MKLAFLNLIFYWWQNSQNCISKLCNEGPFNFFEGQWQINYKSDEISEAILKTKFELPFLLNNLLPDNVINLFCENAVEGFLKNLEK